MRIHVLVKHWGREPEHRALTDACVESLARHGRGAVRITVIDGTAGYEPPILGVSTVEVVPDPGLLASFNALLRLAPYDAWACLNNDVVVGPGWLEAVAALLAADPLVGVAAPYYDQAGGSWLEWPGIPWQPDALPAWDVAVKVRGPKEVRYVPHVDNAAWVLTQAAVERVGLPDERFGGAGWGGNLDYCYRVRMAGLRVAVFPGYVHHAGAATFGADPAYRATAEAERDRILREKYGNPGVVW